MLHFPAIAPEAAQWLIDNRKLKAFGPDSPSIDRGQSVDVLVHLLLYGANIPGLGNVVHLEQLPATGSFVVAPPMKIKDGSGGLFGRIVLVVSGAAGRASTSAQSRSCH